LNEKFALVLWFTKTRKVGAFISTCVTYIILQILFFGNLGGLSKNSDETILLSSVVEILFSDSLRSACTKAKNSLVPAQVNAEIGIIGIYFAKSIIPCVVLIIASISFLDNRSALFKAKIIGKAKRLISAKSVISL
jgi:xanthosine utilization system XapX-like protein